MTPTIVKFFDWPIAVSGFDDKSNRVRDIDLGRMLEFGRPRDIRQLIARHHEGGDLPGIHVRGAVERTKMPRGGYRNTEVFEHWLTLEDALFIVAKSDTKKANKILQLVIRVFTAALRSSQVSSGSRFVDRLLSENKCEHSSIFAADYVVEMSRLFGVEWNGGVHPRFLGGVQVKIYKMLLTTEVYQEMKRRTPEPKHGDNLHQLLRPEAREMFQKELPKIILLAKQAKGRKDFWARMEYEYRGTMLQLGF